MRLLTFSFLRTCKYKKLCIGLPRRICSFVEPETRIALRDPSLVEISPSWKENDNPKLRSAVVRDMQLYPDFITEREENVLLMELEPVLRRMRYEFDHWDNAIQGFRETERSQWSEQNSVVLSRVRAVANSAGALPGDALPGDALPGDALPGDALPGDGLLPHVHVLDLAAAGHIKPHIDAVRFCGDVIAGLCLVSSAVMQLTHVTHAHMQVNALLARRALYIMSLALGEALRFVYVGGEKVNNITERNQLWHNYIKDPKSEELKSKLTAAKEKVNKTIEAWRATSSRTPCWAAPPARGAARACRASAASRSSVARARTRSQRRKGSRPTPCPTSTSLLVYKRCNGETIVSV